ncbi:GSCOCG00011496001-RA-CDS, partial [Cotesia congregata]
RVALNKTTLKTALLKLVTINGRPFSILQDEGMRMILDPLISRMPEKVIINEETVKDDVINTANNIKKTIQKEVKECNLVSLKVDIASRLGRSFLGVNIQYIRGGKIIIRTLAVEEITERHSGENLKNLILRTFDLYGIDVKNIYSFTSDNGTNMVKLSELL